MYVIYMLQNSNTKMKEKVITIDFTKPMTHRELMRKLAFAKIDATIDNRIKNLTAKLRYVYNDIKGRLA